MLPAERLLVGGSERVVRTRDGVASMRKREGEEKKKDTGKAKVECEVREGELADDKQGRPADGGQPGQGR